jgi:hypothetical protein
MVLDTVGALELVVFGVVEEAGIGYGTSSYIPVE